jgi:hypothetical protein
MFGYKTSSYQTSSYRTSRIQIVQDTKRPEYKTSRIQNVQDTKHQGYKNVQDAKRPVTKRPVIEHPGYKTSRIQNFQDTKLPGHKTSSFCKSKNLFKKTTGQRPDKLDAVLTLRSTSLTQLRGRDTHALCGPCVSGPWVMWSMGVCRLYVQLCLKVLVS